MPTDEERLRDLDNLDKKKIGDVVDVELVVPDGEKAKPIETISDSQPNGNTQQFSNGDVDNLGSDVDGNQVTHM